MTDPRTGSSPAVIGRADFEQLCQAAVAMLDPLFAGSEQWSLELAARISNCSAVATQLQLSAFARLANHVASRLERTAPAQADRDAAGAWVAVAIEYCSGQLLDNDCARFIERLKQWPEVAARIDLQKLDRLSSKLAAQSKRLIGVGAALDTMAGESIDAPEASAAPQAAEVHIANDATDAQPNATGIAHDEMQLLGESSAELVAGLGDASVAELSRDACAAASDQALNMANALGLLGLHPAGELFRVLASRLAGSSSRDIGAAALKDCLQAWGAWFDQPDKQNLRRALRRHEAVTTGVRPELVERAFEQLASVRLIESRQVPMHQVALASQDLGLAIPDEADPQVVDQWLIELPALTEAFAQAVSGLAQGDQRQLPIARRIAHTIKGSANIVGVTGVARLTHGLEDLLQLWHQRSARMLPARIELLVDAADCLAQMVDAICGQAQAPTNMASVHADVAAAVNAMLTGAATADEPGDATDRATDGATDDEANDEANDDDAPMALSQLPSLDITDFDLPDLNLPDKSALQKNDAMDERAEQVVQVSQVGQLGKISEEMASEPASLTEPEDQHDAVSAPGQGLRVSAATLDRLLESANEAVITLSQLQTSVAGLVAVHSELHVDSDRLNALAAELDRVADHGAAESSIDVASEMDQLELERYGELNTVSRRISEVAADSKLLEQQLNEKLGHLQDLAAKLERVQSQIREGALATRMVAADTIATRLQRAARQAARVAGKQVSLRVTGASTALDAEVLQRMVEPLAHLVRNAIDHGIEAQPLRAQAGKAATGSIVVTFARQPSSIRITVQDDGAGLNIAAVQARAQALNLIPSGSELDLQAATQLILAPGFSTRTQATQLSGRGIGLDVVSQSIRALKGQLEISSATGSGTSFGMTLPLQMSSQAVFVLRSPTHVLALSVRGVEQVLNVADQVETTNAGMRLMVGTKRLEVRRLDQALGLPDGLLNKRAGGASSQEVVLMVQGASGALTALLVPELGQTRQVVVRRLPASLPRLVGMDGVAVLGDGAVAPVVDLPELIATSSTSGRDERLLGQPLDRDGHPIISNQPVCLVVDDSVSVRRATGNFVADLGMAVDSAEDGQAALDRIAQRMPALVITDLEMPRINGLELARALRKDARTAQLPIIMVTSRSSARHRGLAMAAGVTHFVTKPFSEEELTQLIAQTLN